MTKAKACAVIGRWRITGADLWDQDHLDLVDPAQITVEDNGHGEITFGGLTAGLDCQYGQEIIFFTWQGCDEMDEVQGDRSAELQDDGTLEIEFRYHLGDEAILKAQKM